MTAGAQAQMASEREPAQATAAPEATEPAAVVFQAASVLLEYRPQARNASASMSTPSS